MQNMTKEKWIAVVAGILVVGFFAFGHDVLNFLQLGSFGGSNQRASVQPSANVGQTVATSDVTVGSGNVAAVGDLLTVNYTGVLQSGVVFDSSIPRGQPFQFVLGAGQVIAGWDQGIVGMRVGGRRILVIPPSLAYGDQAIGPIPANSTLIFEVELLSVQKPQ